MNEPTENITVHPNGQKREVSSRLMAGCVIRDNGLYLLVQEVQAKVHGLWNVPGGSVDEGETIERAAERETKEESGLDVRLIAKIDIYQYDATETIMHIFQAERIGGRIKIRPNEIMAVKWVSFAEVEQMYHSGQLRSRYVHEAIYKVEHGYALEPLNPQG